jgi:hypothetical protein
MTVEAPSGPSDFKKPARITSWQVSVLHSTDAKLRLFLQYINRPLPGANNRLLSHHMRANIGIDSPAPKQPVHSRYLLLITGVLLGLHAWVFPGPYFGYDELAYVRLAFELCTGVFEHGSNLYAFRYAVTLPLSGIYFLVGFGDFANTLLSVGSLTLCVGLVLYMLRDYDWRWRALAALLIGTVPIHTMYLGKPMPDIITSLGLLICLVAYYLHRFSGRSGGVMTLTAIFLTGFVLMFLSKESFILLYPYFGVLWLADRRGGLSLRFWWWTLAAVLIFLGLYFGANEWLLGNYRARIDAIFDNRYFSECSYELQPWPVVLKRISHGLWQEMIRMGMLLPVGFLVLLSKRYPLKAKEHWILWTWLGLLLLSNFMTISYRDYVPLCPDPRHFVFTIPLAAMVLAVGMHRLPAMASMHVALVLLALVGQLLIALWSTHENTWWLYLPLILAVVLRRWTAHTRVSFAMASVGLLAMYAQQAHYHRVVNYPAQRELLVWTINQPGGSIRVISDPVNVAIGKMHARYDTVHTQFVRFQDQPELAPYDVSRPDYLIINGYTMYMSYLKWEALPLYAREAHERWYKVHENEAGVIYRRPDAEQ